MKEFCSEKGLKHVPEIFYGTVLNYLLSNKLLVDQENDYKDEFIKLLDYKVQNMQCNMCKKVLPMEGYVIRKDFLHQAEAYKIKNIAFLEMETKQLDSGEADIETTESISGE
jgi:hypothetical protein